MIVQDGTASDDITTHVKSTLPELTIEIVKFAVSHETIVCSDGDIVNHIDASYVKHACQAPHEE